MNASLDVPQDPNCQERTVMPYDLFISYARPDNLDGCVIELVERIAADYRQFSVRTMH